MTTQAPSTGTVRKFNLGDVVTPLDGFNWHPTWIGKSMIVVKIINGYNNTRLELVSSRGTRLSAMEHEFKYAEESVVDRILMKYSNG